MQKRKREFFPASFAVILLAVALCIVLKAEFIFKLILYIAIFVFLSSGSCFKSTTCIQNSLESVQSSCFRCSWRREKLFTYSASLRTLHPLLLLLSRFWPAEISAVFSAPFCSQDFAQVKTTMWEDSALIFLLHIHQSLGYHCTKRMQQTSTADVMSLFSVHQRYKLGLIFLRTVSMSTLYFHTALPGQHQSSLFALKVETNFLFQFDGPGFRSEL